MNNIYLISFFWILFTLMWLFHIFNWVRINRIYDGLKLVYLSMMYRYVKYTKKKWIIPVTFISILGLINIIYQDYINKIDLPLIMYFGLFTIGFSTLSWNILPPVALFLGTSNLDSLSLYQSMKLKFRGLRCISCLNSEKSDFYNEMSTYMDSFRTKDATKWRNVVFSFIDAVPIIIIDLRFYSEALEEELNKILNPIILHKTIIIANDSLEFSPFIHTIKQSKIPFPLIICSELSYQFTLDRLLMEKNV